MNSADEAIKDDHTQKYQWNGNLLLFFRHHLDIMSKVVYSFSLDRNSAEWQMPAFLISHYQNEKSWCLLTTIRGPDPKWTHFSPPNALMINWNWFNVLSHYDYAIYYLIYHMRVCYWTINASLIMFFALMFLLSLKTRCFLFLTFPGGTQNICIHVLIMSKPSI